MSYPKHAAVVKWAMQELHNKVQEQPLGSNSGLRVRFYQSHTWLEGTGWPWCAAFVCSAWEVGGGKRLPWRTAGAWDMGNRARAAGWTVVDISKLVPGDLVVWQIGSGHVSLFLEYHAAARIVRTIDGNTSDRVAVRERPLSQVRNLIHVPEQPVFIPKKVEKPPLFEVVGSESGHKVIYVSGANAVGRKLPEILRRYASVTVRRRRK